MKKLLGRRVLGGLKIEFKNGNFDDRDLFKTLIKKRLYNVKRESYVIEEFRDFSLGEGDWAHEKIILAFYEGGPIGYVFHSEDGVHRFVGPKYRNQGICRALLEYTFPGIKVRTKLKRGAKLSYDEKRNELFYGTKDERITSAEMKKAVAKLNTYRA